jgi:molecular chaperone IbpA
MTYRRFTLNPPLSFPLFNYDNLTSFWNEEAKLSGTYPPYNLTKSVDNKFNITFAVAGFAPEDLEVTIEDNKLHIKGKSQTKPLSEGVAYVHKGIAEREFTRTFTLGEYVEVKNLAYKNGMLSIDLEMVLPESKKPKKFAIKEV